MRKKWIAILAVSLLLSGCGQNEEREMEEPLETFDAEEMDPARDPYEYLHPYTLENQELTAQIYIPEEIPDDGQERVSASRSGISVSAGIVSTDTLPDIQAEEKAIQDMGGTIEETSASDGTTVIRYTLGETELYPCIRIIKSEQLSEQYRLSLVIDVNNMLADEYSQAILEETASAYGLTFR